MSQATPYHLQSFIQGDLLMGRETGRPKIQDTPQHSPDTIPAPNPDLNPRLLQSKGRGGKVTRQLSKVTPSVHQRLSTHYLDGASRTPVISTGYIKWRLLCPLRGDQNKPSHLLVRAHVNLQEAWDTQSRHCRKGWGVMRKNMGVNEPVWSALLHTLPLTVRCH